MRKRVEKGRLLWETATLFLYDRAREGGSGCSVAPLKRKASTDRQRKGPVFRKEAVARELLDSLQAGFAFVLGAGLADPDDAATDRAVGLIIND